MWECDGRNEEREMRDERPMCGDVGGGVHPAVSIVPRKSAAYRLTNEDWWNNLGRSCVTSNED